MKKIILTVFIIAAALAALVFAGPESGTNARPILITNATIIPVVGDRIESGQLLIKDGKIAGLGKNLTAPADAEIIEAAGQFVYPGFIDAYSHFGLAEISAIGATVDVREMGKENPELKAAWGINPASVHFGTSRV
ncbi:MAG: amidohydrolase family protein, partial [Candidatus Aminicenantales bacterium]